MIWVNGGVISRIGVFTELLFGYEIRKHKAEANDSLVNIIVFEAVY